MPSPTQHQGYQVESSALQFLQRKGLIFISKHFRCAYGEIDLIMKDKGTLVFIEVRSRNNPNYASAIESITPAKQRRLIATALFYLQQHNLVDKIDCRFDVIGKDGKQHFYWIQNALAVQY